MAGEITWRQMAAPSGADALRSMLSAGNLITGAFSGGADLAAKYGKLQDEAAQQQYLSLLDSARTPEQMEALRASGQLEQFQQGMTPQALAAVRGAADARDKSLRQQLLDKFALTDAIQTAQDKAEAVANRPVVDAIGMAINQGNYDEATRLINESPLQNKALYFGQIRDAKEQADAKKIKKDLDDALLKGRKLNNDITEVGLDEQRRVAKENDRVRGLETGVNTVLAQRDANLNEYTKLAQAEGWADPQGIVNWSELHPQQLEILTELGKERGLPAISNLVSDTATRDAVIASLKEAGASMSDIKKLLPTVNEGANSLPFGKVGREAAADATLLAQEEALKKYSRQNLGEVTSAEQLAKYQNDAFDLINNHPSLSDVMKRQYRDQLAEFLAEGGLSFKDPATNKTIRYAPSLDKLARIIETEKDWGWVDFFGINSLRSALRSWAKNDVEDIELAKQTHDLNVRELKRSVTAAGQRK